MIFIFFSRFLKTPERNAALHRARELLRNRDRKIARMEVKLEQLTRERGIEVDSDVQKEMEEAIQQNGKHIESLPLSDFQRVFWNQQVHLFISDMYIA